MLSDDPEETPAGSVPDVMSLVRTESGLGMASIVRRSKEDPFLEGSMLRGPPETSVMKSSTESVAPPCSGKKGLALLGFS